MKNRLINALHRLPWSGGDRAGARTGRLSQRMIFAIAAGVLVVLLVLATGLFLKHQSGFVPENNVDTRDIERAQVYLTGVGYANIAVTCGFPSLRSMNHYMKSLTGFSPAEIRALSERDYQDLLERL